MFMVHWGLYSNISLPHHDGGDGKKIIELVLI